MSGLQVCTQQTGHESSKCLVRAILLRACDCHRRQWEARRKGSGCRYIYRQVELYQGETSKFFLLQLQPMSGQTLLAPTMLQVNWPKDKEQAKREKTQ